MSSTSPFDLTQVDTYKQWRRHKLQHYPLALADLFTVITNPQQLNLNERQTLLTTCQHYNFAFYRFSRSNTVDKILVHQLGRQLGLHRLDNNLCVDEDGLTSIQITTHRGQHDYIPYTNKPLSWHTDGYYNLPSEQIQGMVLHCAHPAQEGGESLVMDHEIAYILLRDTDPALIQALMHPHAFTIPANILNGEIIRPAQTGPVFSLTPQGHLHMRYSARQRNVQWRDDDLTQQAAEFLLALWQQDSPYQIRYRLQAGEGLICNNVLHCRTAFTDSDDPQQKRLLYRGRYYDRVGVAN